MTGQTPEPNRARLKAAGANTFSRRVMLRGATATTLSLACGVPLGRVSAQTPSANSALNDLRARLSGQLLVPGESAFDATNTPANLRYQKVIPTAIARCADEADVITCVQWCAENGVDPVVRGGGHSYAGYSTTTGLLIDLRNLNSVTVDRDAGTMTVGGGATTEHVFAALNAGPHMLPQGTCSSVGMGGLTLGGGLGYDSRWAGLTCDHLQRTRLITAGGEPLDVTSSQHSALFWALRGGSGGSFGVNTSFTFNLVEAPAGPVTTFSVAWRGADAAGLALRAFQAIVQDAPREFGATLTITPLDPAISGRRRSIDVSLRGQYIGVEKELRNLLQPLLEIKTPPVDQSIMEQSYWASQRQLIEPYTGEHAFTDLSRFAEAPLPEDVLQQIVDFLVDCPYRTDAAHGAITIFGWVGGVLAETPRDATAYVHRNMTALWQTGAVWSPGAAPNVGEELSAWTQEVDSLIAPHTPSESYQNFPNREITDWQQQYYAENFQRLVEVKQSYDPDNLFRNAQSIPVSSGA